MLPLDKGRLQTRGFRLILVTGAWLGFVAASLVFAVAWVVYSGSNVRLAYVDTNTWTSVDRCRVSSKDLAAILDAWLEQPHHSRLSVISRLVGPSDDVLNTVSTLLFDPELGPPRIEILERDAFMDVPVQVVMNAPGFGSNALPTRALNMTLKMPYWQLPLRSSVPRSKATVDGAFAVVPARLGQDLSLPGPVSIQAEATCTSVAGEGPCAVTAAFARQFADTVLQGSVVPKRLCYFSDHITDYLLVPANLPNHTVAWPGATRTSSDWYTEVTNIQESSIAGHPPDPRAGLASSDGTVSGQFRLMTHMEQCITPTPASVDLPTLSCLEAQRVQWGFGLGGSFALASLT